jgi:hypothetical protein
VRERERERERASRSQLQTELLLLKLSLFTSLLFCNDLKKGHWKRGWSSRKVIVGCLAGGGQEFLSVPPRHSGITRNRSTLLHLKEDFYFMLSFQSDFNRRTSDS